MPGILGTYVCLALVLAASAAVGQAVQALCGRREPSWLAPALGLALLCALAWGTVRLPGEGTAALVALGALCAAALAVLRGRLAGLGPAARIGLPIALAAALAASLPFLVEGRFGILGTGLNPDMSQHLLAAERLASGGSERLIAEGYPLGPHSLVVALTALGPSPVEAFNGLTLAVAVAACLAPLALLGGAGPWRRGAPALVTGLAYLVAAALVQGAFKETTQALFVLAFAIALHEAARPAAAARPALRGVAPAVLAVGCAYAYSFPGLAWPAGALGLWAAVELALAARRGGLAAAIGVARRALPACALGLGLLAVAVAPELGRMASFASFETFDPDGAGLGNLFNRISPLEALGIWPSGDFRVEPGGGDVPALLFHLGAALGAAALAVGLRRWLDRGEHAVPAALGAAVVLWLYSLLAGTPYQESKALVLAAPLVALVSTRALAEGAPSLDEARSILRQRSLATLFPGRARRARARLGVGALALAFLGAAAASSVLVLVNGPVGPAAYSPALAELRPALGPGSTAVIAPPELLAEQHGRDYLVWELRGNRLCVVAAGDAAPTGTTLLEVRLDAAGAVVPAGRRPAPAGAGAGPCPLIPDGGRADPAGDG